MKSITQNAETPRSLLSLKNGKAGAGISSLVACCLFFKAAVESDKGGVEGWADEDGNGNGGGCGCSWLWSLSFTFTFTLCLVLIKNQPSNQEGCFVVVWFMKID